MRGHLTSPPQRNHEMKRRTSNDLSDATPASQVECLILPNQSLSTKSLAAYHEIAALSDLERTATKEASPVSHEIAQPLDEANKASDVAESFDFREPPRGVWSDDILARCCTRLRDHHRAYMR